ncbi:hypothetical protein [Poseidonibacter lekithochrous]|uniref:hypothetical protein n=1 Tax=Poseidonibacter lekithochrous TaxID=1904463 RepID=UPI0008FC77F5|nr:hypothetical protein [Poseidonibacter lekithochrous]QKJ21958.1 hypothetical protein ALEK_0655 [Poseidonibacter lekithochrous]
MENKLFIKSSLALCLLYSSNLYAKTMTFETEVLPVCGIIIDKSNGSINFDDTTSVDAASFTVKTNSNKGNAKISFNNINPSDNIKHKDGFFEIGKNKGKLEEINWKNPKDLTIKHDEKQEVYAFVPQNSSSIISGTARVSTTLEVSCN